MARAENRTGDTTILGTRAGAQNPTVTEVYRVWSG